MQFSYFGFRKAKPIFPLGGRSVRPRTVIPVALHGPNASIHLCVADNNERREWPAIVGFAPVGRRLPVLGFAGFLEYFTAIFHGDSQIVQLTINSLYPGSRP
jgi:hypothetical protein